MKKMGSRNLILSALGVPLLTAAVGLHTGFQQAAAAEAITVHKSPNCGCCGAWIDHLEANGFAVEVINTDDIRSLKTAAGIPRDLASCHTAFVGDYFVEGHVPATDIRRLLGLQSHSRGIAVPGMPAGSPGMEMGSRTDPYQVIEVGQTGNIRVFQTYP